VTERKLKNHELRRARRLVITDGTLGALNGQLTAGILLVKLATEMGADAAQIGIMLAIPQFVSSLQILSSWLLSRTGDPRRVAILFQFLHRLVWMSLGLATLVLMKPGMKGPVWALIIANGFSAFCAQMALVAWYTWVAELAPVRFWGRFLGRKNMIALLFSLPVGLGAGFFVDWWFSVMPKGDLRGLGAMAVLGSSLGLTGVWFLSRVPRVTLAQPTSSMPFQDALRAALADASFRRLALTRCWIMFFVQVAAPMWQFYALKVIGVPVLIMKIWENISNLSNAGGNRLCGRLADHYGYRPVAILFCIGMGTIPVWWILVRPGAWEVTLGSGSFLIPFYWIAVLSSIVGSFSWSGVNLCASNLALKLARREHRSTYVALFQAAFGITGGCGALIGAWIVDLAKKGLRPEEIALAFQLVFLLSAIGRWAAMIGLASVREPDAAPVGRLAASLGRDPLGLRAGKQPVQGARGAAPPAGLALPVPTPSPVPGPDLPAPGKEPRENRA